MKLHRLRSEYREALRIPLGLALYRLPAEAAALLAELVRVESSPLLIAVGDFVTRNLATAGLKPAVAIVDYRTMRAPVSEPACAELSEHWVLKCENPPGALSEGAVEAVRTAIERAIAECPALIQVRGEEDLLALPAIALSPSRSIVAYGLWLGAVVVVTCSPSLSRALSRFALRAFDPPLRLNI